MLGRLKARLGYGVARKLFHQSWCVRQPRIWGWMEGQFARMSNLGDTGAQSFYGHILAFRGQGLGAREEGVRLLRLAAQGGDAKAAYQLGVFSLAGTTLTARMHQKRRAGGRWRPRPGIHWPPLNWLSCISGVGLVCCLIRNWPGTTSLRVYFCQ